MSNFKEFLLNEDKVQLGHRVGDVLTSMQDLQGDLPNMGSRHLTRVAEELVNDIRKILHSQWNQKTKRYLKELQKIGVAIQKTIDERGDLKELIPQAVQTMQSLSGKLGVKVNNLEAPELEKGEPVSQNDFEETGDGPAPKQDPNQMPQDPNQMTQGMPQDPNMAQPNMPPNPMAMPVPQQPPQAM